MHVHEDIDALPMFSPDPRASCVRGVVLRLLLPLLLPAVRGSTAALKPSKHSSSTAVCCRLCVRMLYRTEVADNAPGVGCGRGQGPSWHAPAPEHGASASGASFCSMVCAAAGCFGYADVGRLFVLAEVSP
jgi:hypothetical protein